MSSRTTEFTKLQSMFSDEHLLELSEHDGETVFPNGAAMAICTNCAYRVIEIVGRGEVWGYAAKENPGTEAADGQDGHDFALIDERYLVDIWLCHFAGITSNAVFDLLSAEDSARIEQLYGHPSSWRRPENLA